MLGRFEREMLVGELRGFVGGGVDRLGYECRVLAAKMGRMI